MQKAVYTLCLEAGQTQAVCLSALLALCGTKSACLQENPMFPSPREAGCTVIHALLQVGETDGSVTFNGVLLPRGVTASCHSKPFTNPSHTSHAGVFSQMYDGQIELKLPNFIHLSHGCQMMGLVH